VKTAEIGAGADEGAEDGARAAEQRHDHHCLDVFEAELVR